MSVPFWPTANLSSARTLNDLALAWCGDHSSGSPPSRDWLSRSESTRSRYLLKVQEIRNRWGHRTLGDLEGRKGHLLIRGWRSELQETPRAADETVQVVNALFEFARKKGLIGHNPAAQISQLGCANDYADVFWSDADIRRFREVACRMHLKPVAEFAELLALTGLGVEEAIRLRFDDVGEHVIYRPLKEKDRKRRGLPAYPLLLEAKDFIETLRRRRRRWQAETVLIDGNGASWGRAWILKQVKIIRDAAEIVHVDWTEGEAVTSPKNVKDLSKTWAVKAMRSGATDDDIITLTRWKRKNVAKLRAYVGLRQGVDLEGLSWSERV